MEELIRTIFEAFGIDPTVENINNAVISALVTAAFVIGGAVFSAIRVAYAFAMLKLQERRGPLTGDWTGFVFDENGNVTKRDRYRVYHRGGNVRVEGSREFPANQTGWNWHLDGVWRDRSIIGYYVSDDIKLNSMGVIYLRSDKSTKRLSGYYMSSRNIPVDGRSDVEVRANRYEWVRGIHLEPTSQSSVNTEATA